MQERTHETAIVWSTGSARLSELLQSARSSIDGEVPRPWTFLRVWQDELLAAAARGVRLRFLVPATNDREAAGRAGVALSRTDLLSSSAVEVRSSGDTGRAGFVRVDGSILLEIGAASLSESAPTIELSWNSSGAGDAFEYLLDDFERRWASGGRIGEASSGWAHLQVQAERLAADPDPYAMEELAANLFRAMPGMQPLVQARSPDGGVDVVVWNEGSEPGGESLGNPLLIEVKSWRKSLPASVVDRTARHALALGAPAIVLSQASR